MHCVQIHLTDILVFYLQSGTHLLYADELPVLIPFKLFSPEPCSAKTEHCYFPILCDLSAAFNTNSFLVHHAILPSFTWLGNFLFPKWVSETIFLIPPPVFHGGTSRSSPWPHSLFPGSRYQPPPQAPIFQPAFSQQTLV